MYSDTTLERGSVSGPSLIIPKTASKFQPLVTELIDITKVFVHVANEYIFPALGNQNVKGGGGRKRVSTFGPQRDPFDRLNVLREMAEDFKGHLFEPIHLADMGDGTYCDLDGGGRLTVAAMLGFKKISAFVARGLSADERTRRFREYAKSRVALGRVQDFIAQVAEGDERCVAIYNALKPNYTVKKSGLDAIKAVKALFDIYEAYGVGILRRTAQFAATAWKPKYTTIKGKKKTERKGHAVDGLVLVSLANVLANAPQKFDEGALRRYLREVPPEAIVDKAREELTTLAQNSAKKSPKLAMKLMTQSMMPNISKVIARGYNRRKSDDHDLFELGLIDISPLTALYTHSRNIRED